MKVMGPVNTWLFRATGGRVGGRFPKGQPVLLLTTIGARSGEPRTVPLLYLERGDSLVVVASQGGLPMHPAWYHNVVAHPRVTVETGRRIREMDARVAEEAEKASLWPDLVAMYAGYDDYQARTERPIPVVVLDPATD
jgi:deazaflavin-dependent oxidoreductase (nitroreductase family)